MANPTGTIYLTENTGYVWTDGDVYEIVQTDQQEGAALGASFSGLGVDNQPHQVLLNKLKLTRTKQLTDEANIAALQAFEALFTGQLLGAPAQNYLRIGVQDNTRGQMDYIFQFGYFEPAGGVTGDTAYVVNWPIPFPNGIYWAGATMAYFVGTTPDLGVGIQTDALAHPLYNASSGTFFVNRFNANGSAPGFFWLVVGY